MLSRRGESTRAAALQCLQWELKLLLTVDLKLQE